MLGLHGKSALVTGGGGAIGSAICLRLAGAGCAVAVVDQNRDAAEEVEEQVVRAGGRAVALSCDLLAYDRCAETVGQVADHHGGIDIVVNCVGYERFKTFTSSKPQFWDAIMDINLRTHLNVLHAVLPRLVLGGGGRVVTISSEAARTGAIGEAVYAACKAALVAMSKSLAREHARDKITFNVVSVGPTVGPMLDSYKRDALGTPLGTKVFTRLQSVIPMGRMGSPEDVVGAVAFLSSDDAAFITGQVLSVSGGLTMAG